MKLYYEPAATTCRGIMLFVAEHDLGIELETVDLFSGAHLSPAFGEVNRNRTVPVLVDGALRITEGSAILKYLAEIAGSPAYPSALQARAQVNAAMDWFNTGLYRDLGYGMVYPQVLAAYAYDDPVVQAETIRRAEAKTAHWLSILDASLEDCGGDFICGSEISLADYLGAAYLTLADLIDYDFSRQRQVSRWLERMRARPAWDDVNTAFQGWRRAVAVQRTSPTLQPA